MEKICNVCPRKCKVNREDQVGFCGASKKIEISKIMLHHWEEPVISGKETDKGSGAIFFCHCNLKCVYCQNYEISHTQKGKEYSIEQLVDIFKDLENQGALNINLVTPTHYALEILEALKIYKPKIPVVWNTGGYEDPCVVEKLKNFVDIFLVDLKYFSDELALTYSKCPNYFEYATKSILAMRKICPKDIFKNGLMKKGIIIRHLVLPNETGDSLKVLDWIKENLGTKTFISLMSQYTPHGEAKNYEKLNRKLKPLEYKRVLNHFFDLGFEHGFCQSLDSATEDFIPNFKE